MVTSGEQLQHLTEEQRTELVDGRMSGHARQTAERHLLTCAACLDAVEGERQVAVLLRRLPELHVPRSFALPAQSSGSTWLRAAQVMRIASGAAAVMFVLVLGVEVLSPPWTAAPAPFEQTRTSAAQAPVAPASGAGDASATRSAGITAPTPAPTQRPAAPAAPVAPAAKPASKPESLAARAEAPAAARPASEAAPDAAKARDPAPPPAAAPARTSAPAPTSGPARAVAPVPTAEPAAAEAAPVPAQADEDLRAMGTPTAPLADAQPGTPPSTLRSVAILAAALALLFGAGAIIASRQATHN